jgi:hypothetical protein
MNKHPRIHNEAHLDFIRSLPCLITGENTSVEACHVRFSDARVDKQNAGVGAKPSDIWTVPLCGAQHRRQHTMSEVRFWKEVGIDPIFYALALWAVSGDYERGCRIINNAQPSSMAEILRAG